ncbi:tryptophan--tRNA ligase, mitochondrial [Pectinophora gossypiella]|uniref:tryptophan--tRNA ligase, mitochondrial n=1 Tax=Pectinophora gossypiella TaxID=13191 RepID=UPI00214EDFD3|nr:tryptophan--tRNA ligase, mitochondrial [Pectinophora gossypiella]XP_049874385.1 tryptophan--tRNA ligase, mitochondrial [Pectinophora gossypiella]XP_049874387.1 tryptophan--tRNA ligase, mitochondrial [Pectinophora gossypiella]XP_049874388.1 tryptophan--tRNA ligase, mitochondrial [Pectinophora gossypiella]XP_049874389.1 tryptophan--tRNA ligase, mitochondrial [Pectinophora gossypiella]XP_049874390.1 tryptophan--tRNA ligase, mitochondrial [Pectinophora gossypiella]XP_049874391.1 tryptophan--tR
MKFIRRSLLSYSRWMVCVHRGRLARCSSSNADGTEGAGAAAGGWPRRVVSGLQPTGALHVGNYFGALRRCVREQDAGHDLTLFVADLHALTTHHKGQSLQENTLELTALALAAGVDPARSLLFVQSAVPRHAELCWLLACLCSQARVQHLPQYREKAALVPRGGGAGDGGEVPLGLLLYPVLQAADVLLYRATHVPVGADQQHHLQLAAQLARTFHHRYGPAFPVPRAMLPDDGSDRVRSLRDPSRKMSKSDRDRRATILLTDSDDAIREKIRKAVTDCTPHVSFEPELRPGVSNLVALHCLAEDKLPEEAVEESDGLTTAQYKRVVAEALCGALRPLRARAAELRARPRLLRDVLRAGAARARLRADHTYAHVAQLAGLAQRPPRPALASAADAVSSPISE